MQKPLQQYGPFSLFWFHAYQTTFLFEFNFLDILLISQWEYLGPLGEVFFIKINVFGLCGHPEEILILLSRFMFFLGKKVSLYNYVTLWHKLVEGIITYSHILQVLLAYASLLNLIIVCISRCLELQGWKLDLWTWLNNKKGPNLSC